MGVLPPRSPRFAPRSTRDLIADDMFVGDTVYAPQEDSHLLVEAMRAHADRITGARVLDLCCGSGVIGIAAARLGAAQVVSFDINPEAVASTAANAARAGVVVDARQGSLDDAEAMAPFDVVLSNPPYVPAPGIDHSAGIAATAWDAGLDGRSVLDPLCSAVPSLLTPDGMFLVIHSETADVSATVAALDAAGLETDIVLHAHIALGPVMTERAEWLSAQGLLASGARTEGLAVIRARR